MFPVLSRMAMDIISVQASSVASESAFSTSGRVLSIRRTRLTPASLEMCMCLKDHLDAKERKQDKCPLETPLDFEESVFDDEVQQNEAIPLSDEEIALDASSEGTMSPGGPRSLMITSSFNPCIEDLPENVMADIISRLPVKKIIHCKSVCKDWREIVSDSYFIILHLSRSPRCVMIHHKIQPDLVSESDSEDEDEDETVNLERSGVLYRDEVVNSLFYRGNPLYPEKEVVKSYVCNPITREYVILPRPQYVGSIPVINNHGFGVGLVTKEYKVVWIFLRSASSLPFLLEAEVFTLGTGQWRRLGRVPYWINRGGGFFLNGCVHWIVNDNDSPEKLCSFNIDETFELFPYPSFKEIEDDVLQYQNLGILNGCLSLSGSSSSENDLDDGTILMLVNESRLLVYCPRKKTIEKTAFYKPYFTGKAFRPSFLKLQTSESERLIDKSGGAECVLVLATLMSPPLRADVKGVTLPCEVKRDHSCQYRKYLPKYCAAILKIGTKRAEVQH
ncbi:F-box associated domain containing protein [Tanacetum coccineum]